MEQLRFEMKNMGFYFYIPLILFLILCMTVLLSAKDSNGMLTFIVVQVLFIPMSSWWAILLIYELYHNNSEEILIQLYSHKLLFNYSSFSIIFLIFVLVLATMLEIKFEEEFRLLELCILFISQTLVISSAGLLIAIFFKSVETSLMVIIMYISTEVITLGDLMPWPHIFFFKVDFTLQIITLYSMVSLVFFTIFLVLSLKFVKTMERKVI